MRRWLFALTAVTLAGCPDNGRNDGGAEGSTTPTYGEIQTILTTSCAVGETACHNTPGSRGGLDLTVGTSFAQLVNRRSTELTRMNLVTPGDPANSFMMHKVDGTLNSLAECTATSGLCGVQMPMIAGGMLPQPTRDRIRAWIAAGAPGP